MRMTRLAVSLALVLALAASLAAAEKKAKEEKPEDWNGKLSQDDGKPVFKTGSKTYPLKASEKADEETKAALKENAELKDEWKKKKVTVVGTKARDEQGHEFILVDALKTADGMVKRSTDK